MAARARILAATASILAAVVAALPAPASAARSSPVTGWVNLTLHEIRAHGANPPRASRALALVSVAMERAAAGGAAQVHGAAEEALAYLFPDRAAAFSERAERLASARMLAAGRRVGAALVERARRDGSSAVFGGVRPTGPEHWEPAPPGFAGPLEPAAGSWRTWNIRAGSSYRPPPPPQPGDATFERELLEVYDVARSLTDDQRRIALFWADGAGTETPPGHWNRIALALVRGSRLSARQAATLFAALNSAQADAFIAAWDAKFAYWSLRPITAIRRTLDPGWSPLIATPPFPGYVSGHSTTSGAASTVLSAWFPRRRRVLAEMADEAAVSRLYGGIHFTADNDAGLVLGKRVGRAAVRAYRR